ncbi:toprim domain-containing protein [Siphonobacter curvatus]|uniref:Mobilization protein n=1 Tax=Siphonobacter curvatus TaxID=2094562 RepID=A0A2S7INW8_9BACT|nr:toprim domain-containing protein [Siphonobacter curvatus]PQA59421.1 mobilization protein [Siphonobacter curvatus]
MTASHLLENARSYPIYNYLQTMGYLPVKKSAGQLLYSSPLRAESSPSFFVHPGKNVFNDFGCDEHKGDVIRLCQMLENLTFSQAVERLNQLQPMHAGISFSFSGQSYANDYESKFEIIAVKQLSHASLVQYVESRGIPLAIAGQFLQEVHYVSAGRKYFAAGFKNDLGGYALRNGAGFKGQTRPAGITTLPGKRNEQIYLFEGFFDFLSALTFFSTLEPKFTTCILNSTAQLSKAIDLMKQSGIQQVHAFLDRDAAGFKAVDQLARSGFHVTDRSDLYRGSKDFNEYLISHR